MSEAVPAQHASILVVVPTLESHWLLPRLVHSLVAQSWPGWRLLFIDGASGAEHRSTLASYAAADPRICWQLQDPAEPGIFGAMNQGFAAAGPDEWLLFWGSDDWAASATALARLMEAARAATACSVPADLLVCRARYADAAGSLGRPSLFACPPSAGRDDFRRSLFLGSTPPHQATLIAPAARRRPVRHAPRFRLAGDLDYFLRLSDVPDLRVQVLPLELVHLSAGGISGQQTRRRLQEVRRAYRSAFGIWWWVPFLMRYVRRLGSVLQGRWIMGAAAPPVGSPE